MELVKVGDIIVGKYEITRVLGKGGMGLVVAARHLELDGLVALKFLLPEVRERPGISARFAQEGRTGTRIKNEHVARVYDVGTTDGGPFIVMEHLVGRDLAAVIRDRGQLPIAESADLLLQACEAIAEAHTLGIVHRDLKPGNLFVTEGSDGTPFVKVLDFGISKTTTTDDVSVTGSTGVLGSLLYMSPEQLLSPGKVDPRADIWALGVILYEMLTGTRPFEGDSFKTVYPAILRGAFQALSERRGDVPPQLGQMVADALAVDRTMRLASVEAFGARLAPFGTDAARASLARVRGIVARASAASKAAGVAADVTLAPTGAGGGTAKASGHGTEPGVARSENPTLPRPNRWRWPVAGLGAVAAVALAAFVRLGGHTSSGASGGPVGCAVQGVAACETECAEKKPDSCYQLAKILDNGVLAPKDQARAATLYQVACDAGVYAGCNNLGALYGSGEGVPHDDIKAVALYKLACDHDHALACANLGVMHFEGKGLPKNESVGARLFFRACEAGEPRGCLSASAAYAEGRGVPKDVDQAFAYAERACAGGAARGCVRVARAKVTGEGVAKDVKGGLAELDAICNRGEANACEVLGSLYAKGVGSDVPADPVRVRAYEKKGCDLGSKTACSFASVLGTIDRGDTPQGQISMMLVTQCDEGKLFACGTLGENLLDGRGVGVDRGRGMELLERACGGKVERACERLKRERGDGGAP